MEVEANEININRYINNELSGDELIAFEALLKKDKALQEKVNFHKEVNAVLVDKMASVKSYPKEEALLLPTLNELGKEFFLKDEKPKASVEEKRTRAIEPANVTQSKPGLVKRLAPFVALAAAAAVLLFVIAPWKSNLSNTQLADKQFEPFDLEYIMDSTDNQTIYEQAKKAYYNKNYQASLPLFTQYLETNPNSPKALLAKGSAEFKLNQLEEAVKSFKLATGNASFKAIAHWYLALTYLKKENKDAAQKALSQIKKGEEKFEAAQKLLQQIK